MEWLDDTSWPKPAPAEFHLKLVAAAARVGGPGAARGRAAPRTVGRVGRRAAGGPGRAGRLGGGALARGRGAEAAGRPALAGGLRTLLDRDEGTTMNANGSLHAWGRSCARGRWRWNTARGRARPRARRGRAGGGSGRDAGRDGAERLRKIDPAAPAGRSRAPVGGGSVAGGDRIDQLSEKALAGCAATRSASSSRPST